MTIDQGTKTLAVTTKERTWRTNIETPYGGEAVVTVWREVVMIGPDGKVISRENIGYTIIDQSAHADIVEKVEVAADAKRVVDIAAAEEAATYKSNPEN